MNNKRFAIRLALTLLSFTAAISDWLPEANAAPKIADTLSVSATRLNSNSLKVSWKFTPRPFTSSRSRRLGAIELFASSAKVKRTKRIAKPKVAGNVVFSGVSDTLDTIVSAKLALKAGSRDLVLNAPEVRVKRNSKRRTNPTPVSTPTPNATPTSPTSGPTDGNVITAASCQSQDVQAAIDMAQEGDTVVIPAGSANWTQGVIWNAPPNVTLKGSGTSATGGGDRTVISDDISSSSALLAVNVSSSGVFRMTGITFQSGTGAIKDGGTLRISGPGKVRLDHLHLNFSSGANYKILVIYSGVFGVLDHSILDLNGPNAIYLYNGRNGPGDWMGNLEWSLPTEFGGPDYFFIEDNIINGNVGSGTYSTRIYDGFTAAKVVVRFNDVSQACLGETHATGHAFDDRGLRSQEAYGNKVTSTLEFYPNYTALDMGSGTTLLWGNTWDQVYKNIYLFKVTRKNKDTYAQSPTPTSWGYAGTQFNGTGSMWDGGTAFGTDTLTGYPALDQPGRGQGDLLTGAFPNKINSVTGTIHWPNQALEPIYIWNNVGGPVPGWGGATFSDNSGGRVVANRDYYPSASGQQTSPTTPFNGTSGTGWGTLARRPTTCASGVGYFATDQGSWNKSTSNSYGVQLNGADGVLYKCTAPNTWTLYYEPYTYPHPLQK